MKILVVEDDRRIADFLRRGLAAEGHDVAVEHDGRDGLDRVRGETFDVILLDRVLPYVDGMEFCRMLREERMQVPVLMLTAKDALKDKIDGLQGGADDYMTKPFAFDEVLARIDALHRRANRAVQPAARLQVGDLTLFAESRQVEKAGRTINLTPREFDLLRFLITHAGRAVSRERLLSAVWNYGYDPGTKLVDVYVRYLRLKLDEEGAPSAIETVRGVGYMIPRPGSPSEY